MRIMHICRSLLTLVALRDGVYICSPSNDGRYSLYLPSQEEGENRMNNTIHSCHDPAIQAARAERDQAIAGVGSKILHTPGEFLRIGIDDFKRFCKPLND